MILKLIYSFLYSIALFFILPFQYKKRPKDLRQRWLREKFGTFNFSLSTFNSSLIWIHAVSVGEVIASLPLLEKLKVRYPSVSLVLSTITDTGQKVAMEKASEGTKVIYLPFDLNFILKRTFKKIHLDLFITIETELWPNLLMTLKKRKIPAVVMNGRISDDSFKGYKKIKFFMRSIISCVDLFCMQDAVYAGRIKELGAQEEKIRVIGSFKFDTVPSLDIPEWTKLLSHPVIIAGSTHRGEEDLIVSSYIELKKDFPGLTLIIAPRHPERFKEVEELIKAKGLSYVKRSQLIHPFTDSPIHQIIILDAVGELASVYGVSDVAVIGGSFIEHGGQNLLEPAFWAKPIICGPHMENFPFAKEFYEKGAAIEADSSTLYEKLKELLQSPEKKKSMGNKAKDLYNEKSGAVERAMKEIERFLRNEAG
ncbi:MAG: 3-deoxy-D-manno-octulosonic acid transferase [Nitrospirae bacterium]|nr:3-deoxy-D-manno-octulosonic acid transferase [Nitrospirota bacterium]MBI3376899.1 3-deoxy-D-manno-octulosonic acid transferase [Nitrospirota bacterium]